MNATLPLSGARAGLLLRETRWLVSLRWLAGAAIVVLGVLSGVLGSDRHQWVVIGVGVLVLAYNTLVWWALGRDGAVLNQSRVLNLASLQIALDLVCLAVLAGATGGVGSAVMFAFLPHMLFASLLQPMQRAIGLAALSIGGVGVALVVTHQWPASAVGIVVLLGWVGTLLLTVYLTHRVTSALYQREEAWAEQHRRNEEMWSRLAAQQATLMQAEKMSVMGQMVAGIAHEITNPLSNMDSVLQLMQRNAANVKPASITTLRQQVERILQIMRQFNTFSHPGHEPARRVRVNDVANATLEMLAFNRGMKRVEVRREFDEAGGGAVVLADPHALQQVLTNMIVNALDAVAERVAPRITIATRRRGGWCEIEVSDNSVGIPAAHLPRVFDSFFTTKPVGKGTGLGLSICARIVREQGGRIEVRSEEGVGTSFVVTLPTAETGGVPRDTQAIPAASGAA